MENLEKTLLKYFTKTYVSEVIENVTYIKLDDYTEYRRKFLTIYENEIAIIDYWISEAIDGSKIDDMIIVEENGIKYLVCMCL